MQDNDNDDDDDLVFYNSSNIICLIENLSHDETKTEY